MVSSADPHLPPPALEHDKQTIEPIRQQIFESQDLDKGNFDVTFEVEGKQLHAHKFMLASHSETFEKMFSTLWYTSKAPIQINDYTFHDFKMFLGSLYFAPVQLTNNNIMTMVDLAEYYGVQRIKDQCDEWLSTKQEFTPLTYLYEATKKYTLMKSKTAIISYVLKTCLKTPEMIFDYGFSKELIIDVLTSQRTYYSEESLFNAVYDWAFDKHRYLGISSEAFFKAMKFDLAYILPCIKFEDMTKPFFQDFILPIKYIFDDDSWKAIERIFVTRQVFVKSGQLMLKGTIYADENTIDIIKSLENIPPNLTFSNYGCCWWSEKGEIPSKPSQLTIIESVPFYLSINRDLDIFVKPRRAVTIDDYLLAELYGTGHCFTWGCRISVV